MLDGRQLHDFTTQPIGWMLAAAVGCVAMTVNAVREQIRSEREEARAE